MLRSALIAAALLASAGGSPALAAWSSNPAVNNPVCTVAGDQIVPRAVDDGAGGVIVVWVDHRAASGDIYAMRIDVLGNRVAGWPASGRAVCTAAGEQDDPAIVADGAGGAVIAWTDARGGSTDIYALRIQGNGSLAPGWPAAGLPLCVAPGNQGPASLQADDAGGAFVVWRDRRAATFDLYATHVRFNGSITAQWPANGLAVCAAPGDQDLAVLATDMQNGLYVAWQDGRAGQTDIYASRFRVSGALAPGWVANGRAVCVAAGHQFAPTLASDGNRGIYVVWEDFRLGPTSDLYGLRLLNEGNRAAGWPADGLVLCGAAGNQFSPRAIADGAGSVIFAWEDYRNGSANGDIFAQKVRPEGSVYFLWPADGLGVCTAAGLQHDPRLVSDGALGAIVLWEDYRAGAADANVYGKRVGQFGSLPDYWGTNGIPIANAGGAQQFVSAAVGTNPIVMWQDTRSGGRDIYAQRVEQQGTLGFSAPVLQAGPARGFETNFVELVWSASPLDVGGPASRIVEYRVRRCRLPAPIGGPSGPFSLPSDSLGEGGIEWELVGTIPADGSPSYSFTAPPPGTDCGLFIVEAADGGDPAITWPSNVVSTLTPAPVVTSVPLEPASATPWMESPRPNPVTVAARVGFALADASPVELAVFGVDGRRVRTLLRGAPGAGPHEIAWDLLGDDGRRVPAGVYFVTLEAGGRRIARRVSVVQRR